MRYIGLDIGGTKCAAVLGECGKTVEILDKEQFLTAGLTPWQVLETFSRFYEKHAKNGEIKGIGISCGGPLDSKKGVIMSPPSLPLWDNIQIVKYFEDKYGVPTRLQNDANAGAVAEWKYGAGTGSDDVVFITFGTGFGAGVISGGRLLTGANDNFGEIGHVRLTKKGPLGYYKEGSAEGYCSGSGINRLAKIVYEREIKRGKTVPFFEGKNIDETSAKELAEGAKAGDPFCKKVYKISGEKLGQALSILIDVLNPEIIVIGGVFMRSKDLLLPHAEKVIKKEALLLSRKVCKVVPAKLSENIGDMAALCVAMGEY